MSLEVVLAHLALVLLLSIGLTGVVRRAALRAGLLDVPNARSSHSVPTPRGGGIAIVISVAATVIALAVVSGVLPLGLAAVMVLGGGLVALVGFLDDRGHVPAPVRLLVHLLAVVGALRTLGVPAELTGAANALGVAWLGPVLACLACVWFLNLFNFMDGIDGIAASEAVFVAGSAALLVTLQNGPQYLIVVWLVVASASAGFLVWNWAPAKIFMGDVGSGFLGFVIALLLVLSITKQALPIWTAFIIVTPFVSDATATLARRIAGGEQWYAAHRSHAYQRLSRRWGSHARVTLLLSAVNLLIVLPVAILSLDHPRVGVALSIMLLAMFGVACLAIGAGRTEGLAVEGGAARGGEDVRRS